MIDRDITNEIPYQEYRAINELVRAHREVHGERFRAAVAFGGMLTSGSTFDIELLEVVEDYDGPQLARFEGSSALPLRGELRIYLLRPEHFEQACSVVQDAQRHWTEDLMTRVRQGYEVFWESPAGYARGILERTSAISTLAAPTTGMIELDDPFEFTGRTATAR